MTAIETVTGLLRKNGMDPSQVDLGTMAQIFAGQMRIGLYGGAATMGMRPTGLADGGVPRLDEPVAVIQVRDGQIQTALVTLTQDGPQVAAEEPFTAPGVEYPAPWEDFIYALAELVEPVLDRATEIALCLPYPVDCDGQGDGTLAALPDGMRLEGWEGKPIRAALAAELADRGITGKGLTLVPYTAAAQLGGTVLCPGYGRCYGLTWGEEVNVTLTAPWSVVLKQPGMGADLTILDTGVGACTGVPFGMVELTMDRDSPQPGTGLLNKMVSARTLGDIYRFTMIKAVEDRLLSFKCGRDFLSLRSLSLDEVDDFLQNPRGQSRPALFCELDQDRAVALGVAQGLLDRAAKLICAHLAAVLAFTGGGLDKPALIAGEGRVLEVPYLRQRLEAYLEDYIGGKLGRACHLETRENLTLIGGAAGALLQP